MKKLLQKTLGGTLVGILNSVSLNHITVSRGSQSVGFWFESRCFFFVILLILREPCFLCI